MNLLYPPKDDRVSGRWSARHHRALDSEGASMVKDNRSFAGNEMENYNRKSLKLGFEKGQTLHRSAIHAKTSGLIPKGPVMSMHDAA